MRTLFTTASPVATVVISVAVMLTGGFLLTRVTKRFRLPDVTAYIVAGILIGPYCLNLIPETIIVGTDFLPDIALSFIAFSTGQFFRLDVLKKNGIKVVFITLFEALAASLLVFLLTFFCLRLSMAFSLVLSALASATAPASTIMTIRQTHARGDFVDTLLQVVALDDVVGLIAYSVAISIADASLGSAGFDLVNITRPLITNGVALLIGILFGVLMSALMKRHSTDNRLIIAIALLSAFCGICALLDISPLLGCMSMATAYINITDDVRLFKQLSYWSPPLLLMFFVRSGLSFNLGILFKPSGGMDGVPLIVIGVLYFIVRIIGKYAGAYAGCKLVGKDKQITNWLGLALIPQAGVAIGLAALGARALGANGGSTLHTIILSSSVLYELIGPVCAKTALKFSGAYSDRLEDVAPVPDINEAGKQKTETEKLIERIHEIQNRFPPEFVTENEDAFSTAAEEYEQSLSYARVRRRRLGR